MPKSASRGLKYQTGDPSATGVYACRVPALEGQETNLMEDEFLMWMDGRWWRLGSDQKYRGTVLGWIGPLPRRM